MPSLAASYNTATNANEACNRLAWLLLLHAVNFYCMQ